MSKHSIYHTSTFRSLLAQCCFFKLQPPKGGQYNDGFELNGILKAQSQSQFLDYLDKLDISFTQQTEAPKPLDEADFDTLADYIAATTDYAQLKLPETTTQPWLVYKKHNHCLGLPFYVSLTTDPFEIHLNTNGTSWYEVSIADLKQALLLEEKMTEKGLL